MRPVLHGDVVAVARAVMTLPAAMRGRRIRAYLDMALAADAYRKRFGRAHPVWGNGALMSAVGPLAGAEPPLSDRRYCASLAQVFEVLLDWRAERQQA